MIEKMLIYKNRTNRGACSIVHFERLMEMERELEEYNVIQYDKIELYERKWGKYITRQGLL